jgi:hypothetical protein
VSQRRSRAEHTGTLYNDPFWSIGQSKAITAPELEKWVQEIRTTTMPKDYAAFKLKQFSSKPLGKDIILLSYVGDVSVW